jgi:hypothetical protein
VPVFGGKMAFAGVPGFVPSARIQTPEVIQVRHYCQPTDHFTPRSREQIENHLITIRNCEDDPTTQPSQDCRLSSGLELRYQGSKVLAKP